MNNAPVVNTTAASLTTVSVAGCLKWAAAGFPAPMPDDVSLTIAAALIILGHIAYRATVAHFDKGATPNA